MTASLSDYMNGRVEHRWRETKGGHSRKKHSSSALMISLLIARYYTDPWLVTQHEETLNGHAISWTRPGRLWTIEDRQRMTMQLDQLWHVVFPTGSTLLHYNI